MKVSQPPAYAFVAMVLFGGLWAPAEAQFIQQGSKLVGDGIAGRNALQGYSVAVSADGSTVIVGGVEDNNGIGAAWVFTRNGDVWRQQGSKLVGLGAGGPTGAQMGNAVALSADGNTAIVGSPTDNLNTGGVWVFTRSAGEWSQQGPKLLPSGAGRGTYAGWSVALSADGNTAALSGPSTGVWIFTRAAGVWTQQAKLTGAGAVGTLVRFGDSVALSAEGNTAAVGGDFDNELTGATWIFTRTRGQWTQQGPKLVGSGAIGAAAQGHAVALSADGNTVMIGGHGDSGNTGAVWAFIRTNGVWSQQGDKLTAADPGGNAAYGLSVALSGDGNTAVIGAPSNDSYLGAVRIIKRTSGVWSQQGPSFFGMGAVGLAGQGTSVAISADGNTAVVGGPNDSRQPVGEIPPATGATWIFVRTALLISAASSAVAGVPFPFTVTATGPGNIVQSSYRGTVYFTSSDRQAGFPSEPYLPNGKGTFSIVFKTPGTQTITVSDSTLSLLTATSSGIAVRSATVAISPTSLNLQYYQGTDPAAAPGILTVSSDANIPFSVSSADPWIAALPVSGTAPATIAVRPNPAGLVPDNYKTVVTIAFADGRSISVPVSMVVYDLPQLEIIPAIQSLTFTVAAGAAAVQTRDVTVVAQPRNVTVQTSAASFSPVGGNWLFVSPATGMTPALLHVLVNPAGLTPGTYEGRIAIASSEATNSPLNVTVKLSVLARPAISVFLFANAASRVASAGAPNTLMLALGEFPGCTSGAELSLDRIATRVLASAPDQIEFLVPPEVAGKKSISVQISCAGLKSQEVSLEITEQAPAIFTLSESGVGQAAIINEDGSRTPPSPPGTTVTILGTGFGLLGNPGEDGLARVLSTVTASIGGTAGTIVYAGEDPQHAPGLQHIKVLIPGDSPRGPEIPLRLSAGGVDTQAGITLAIQ